MYRVLDESEQSNLGIKVESGLTEQDYEMLLPYLEGIIRSVGPVNLLFDMTTLDGERSVECWKDVMPKLERVGKIPRVAVVGTFGSSKMNVEGPEIGPLPQVHWFPSEKVDEAWTWLKSGKNGR